MLGEPELDVISDGYLAWITSILRNQRGMKGSVSAKTFRPQSNYAANVASAGGDLRETPRGRFRRGVLSQFMLNLRSARGAKVDLALGQRGQLFVSGPFLIEGLLQDTGAIVAAKLLRPRDQAAVARDLIMLGGLGGVDQCGIQHRFVLDLADDL